MTNRNLGGWQRFTEPDELVPIDDIKPHIFGKSCWCKPVNFQDVLTHNALDDREAYEEGLKKLH